MSTNTLYRLCGFALLLGGLLAAITTLIRGFVDSPLHPFWVPSSVFYLIGNILVLLGAPALFTVQAEKAGKLGLIGLILFLLEGFLLGIAGACIDIFVLPWIMQNAHALQSAGYPNIMILSMLGGILGTIGVILLGAASLRARFFPRIAIILLIVGTVVNFVAQVIGGSIPFVGDIALALLFVAFAWLGYLLWATPLARTSSATQLTRVPVNS